ncbi:MAG: topoisomerase, partial [Verrucomicrobiota bacterium]
YLREVSGADFTAKDFRTWEGTVLAVRALSESEKVETKADAKKNVVAAVADVAAKLGNTPAVCKKCYIHPDVIDSYLDGTLAEIVKPGAKKISGSSHLQGEEVAVLRLLQNQLTLEQKLSRSLKKETAVR